jgi:hypothetical protein
MSERSYESIYYRATRRGFQITAMRGREAERRRTLGLGQLMLLCADSVVLFAATADEIDDFLEAHDKAQKRLMH